MHTIDMATTILTRDDTLYSFLSAFCMCHKSTLPAITIEEKTLVLGGSAKKTAFYYLLHIDCLMLLAKRNVESCDIPDIRFRIDTFLAPACVSVDDFHITRIDYCKNISVSDEAERNALFACLNRLPGTQNYQHQTDKFSHGVYWHNKSRVTMVYDKTVERGEKHKAIRLYEKGVVRLEYQVKARALKYADLPRNYSTWVSVEMEDWYLLYASRAFPCGDFWDIDTAVSKIDASRNTPAMKANLRNYIYEIAATDMDTANAGISRDTAKKYIQMLDDIEVNPITIDSCRRISHIKNPLVA